MRNFRERLKPAEIPARKYFFAKIRVRKCLLSIKTFILKTTLKVFRKKTFENKLSL